MRISVLFALFLFFNLLSSPSSGSATQSLAAVENELISDEWAGAKAVLAMIRNAGKEECSFLGDRFKSEEAEFVKIRLLKTISETNCKARPDLALKALKEESALIRAEAVVLASRLPPKDRAKVLPEVRKLKTSEDPAIKRVIRDFPELF